MSIRNLTTAARFLAKGLLRPKLIAGIGARSLSHYPIDETIFGLTEEQQQVRSAGRR